MSIEQVKDEIRRFLASDQKIALCLTGKWGVGKTYTWENLLADSMRSKTAIPSKYAYVSLFGLESLADIRRSLFENTVEAAAFASSGLQEATIGSVSGRLMQVVSKWRAGVGIIQGIPIIADYSSLAEKAGFLDVREQIVCFDDIERKSDGLALKDILGMMSHLKEKKNCKVALLLNEDAINPDELGAFKAQLEKIIDINLVFSPTPHEAAKIALADKNSAVAKMVSSNTVVLGISNIRTILKLLKNCERIECLLRGYDQRVIQEAIRSACLYGFTIYQPTDSPSLDMVLNYNNLHSIFGEVNTKSREEMLWEEVLREYGYDGAGALDIAIYEGMKAGFFEESKIKKEADIISKRYEFADKNADFSNAWNIYHDSFQDDAEEFAAALKKSIVENAIVISRQNLSTAVAFLKRLGYEDDIHQVIDGYVAARKDEKEFWTEKSDTFRFGPEDPDVTAAFDAKAAEFDEGLELEAVLADIVRNRGWSDDLLAYIDRNSEEDFFQILKKSRGNDLHCIARGLTYFVNIANPNAVMQSISTKATAALRRIGMESELNRLRVGKYGVEITENDT